MKGLMRPAGVFALAGVLFLGTGCGGGGDDGGGGGAAQPPKSGGSTTAPAGGGGAPGYTPDPATNARAKKQYIDCIHRQGLKEVPDARKKLPKAQRDAIQKCVVETLRSAAPSAGATN
ncbi:hypothetical protein [Thermomonospora umbrina]|uniref:Uncharacterized protein n=1 Tax=Thermomonospora umbrina TaxID=111806 RepID=A0A3D9T1V2_9ACTN|nr:hypothetical protein [Thermomonospora umbrina]REE97801.1 hypothetical protein DFJ69_3276 [Thermomonospora umbrina]